MSTQLNITKEVMEAAGWKSELHVMRPGYWDTTEQDNEGGFPVWVPPAEYRLWIKGTLQLAGYGFTEDFYADSRHDGENRARHEAAGLLDLPHHFS